MEKEYVYSCCGCEKQDKEYWYDEETGQITAEEELFGTPSVKYHKWTRSDAYGIYTGLYCDKCYNDNEAYPYRKDEYYDEGYAGEQLYPDE